jgi:acyl-coenzyme A thioesterase PaaI-like protein
VSPERLVHHELCFGCGRTNLFGLLMELEAVRPGVVRGRGFVKQDHQGSVPSTAHEGIVIAALSEAMSMACGTGVRATRVQAELRSPVPVGVFLEVEARLDAETAQALAAHALASVGDETVATAHGAYARLS